MKVLVTGASGRIGANIVRELLDNGFAVRAAVRPGSPRAQKLQRFSVEVVEADLLDPDALARSVEGSEAVVHNGVVFTGEPAAMIAGSLQATAALLEAARLGGCSRFVFISSTAVYEGSAYRPGDPVREEEASPALSSVYGACKLAAEALCSAYYRQHGLPTVCLRLPMVTAGAELLRHGFLLETWRGRAEDGGEQEAGRERAAWRAAIERAWQEGRRIAVPQNQDGTAWKRHFCDVRDAARAVRLALVAAEAPGQACNIASVPLRYDEAARALSEVSGWQVAEISSPEDYRYEFALHRAAEFLGYSPAYTGPQMIRDAWRQHAGEEVPELIAP